MSKKEGKAEHYEENKAKRTVAEQVIGLEPSEEKNARRRNGLRRKIEELKKYFDELVCVLLGMVKSFGHDTADLVIAKIQDFIRSGEELFLKVKSAG